MITAQVNTPYQSRIQLLLGGLTGPLSSTALGAFDPRRDLEVYIGGEVMPLLASSFDTVNNRYLLFTARAFDTAALVQVIHHMPSAPFTGAAATLPGFALIAGVSTDEDAITPSVGISVPSRVVKNTTTYFTWNAVAVAQIRITASNGYDSGLVSATANAGVVYTSGSASSGNYTATIAAFDVDGTAITVNGTALTASVPLVITTN